VEEAVSGRQIPFSIPFLDMFMIIIPFLIAHKNRRDKIQCATAENLEED
jgi:hypothetical protein